MPRAPALRHIKSTMLLSLPNLIVMPLLKIPSHNKNIVMLGKGERMEQEGLNKVRDRRVGEIKECKKE